jgi:peptidoglycan/LPS O-acetylase OafA/YrhL
MKDTKSNYYIPSLDGMRAVAAMLVFVSHAGWPHLIPGGFGVTIFFFLSGYLITTLLRREYESTGSISFKNFFLRRAYRIFPPLYIVLFLIALLAFVGVVEHQMQPWAVISQIFYWTNYYIIFYGKDHLVPATAIYWSLAIEEHFYLIFPFLFTFAIRKYSYAKAAMIFVVICIFVLIWRCWLVWEVGVPPIHTYYATDTRFDSLLFGCIMGVWKNPMMDDTQKFSDWTSYLVLCVAIAVLLFCLIWRDVFFRETFRYTLQGVALFPIFWLAIRHPDWLIFKWLNWRPVRFFGVISYTFYLSHVFLLFMVDRFVDSDHLTRLIFSFILAVLFSALMFYLVERPIVGLRRRLHN